MTNDVYFHRLETDSGALYREVAETVLSRGLGATITPRELCVIAGFDATASQEAAMLVSVVSEKMKKGVDRYFEINNDLIGFARQANVNKDKGINFLIEGNEFLMDRRLHQLSLLMRAQINFTTDTRKIAEIHQGDMTRKEKQIYTLFLSMAENSVNHMESLAEKVIPRLIRRDDSYTPLASLQVMLIETAETMRA